MSTTSNTMTLHLEDLSSWRDAAACARRPDVDFFVSPEDAPGVERATAVCASCPVAAECLAFAIETNQPDGIWGGMTATERSRLRRRWMQDLRQAS